MLGSVDLKLVKDFCGDEFIYQDAGVLRVILELDDVKLVVVGLKQMGLGTAPHFSYKCSRGNGHESGRSISTVAAYVQPYY